MKKALVAPLVAPVLFVLVCTVALFACPEDDVGVPCKMNIISSDDGGISSQGATVNAQGLDCRSRLCLYVGGVREAIPQCTRICDNDDDCPDPTDTCKEGFTCQSLIKVGALKCCKMCVCKRFVNIGDGGASGSASCANITPNCPKL
jgi:hypothetical protein